MKTQKVVCCVCGALLVVLVGWDSHKLKLSYKNELRRGRAHHTNMQYMTYTRSVHG